MLGLWVAVQICDYVHGEMRCGAFWTTLMLSNIKIMSSVSENSNFVHQVGYDECLMNDVLSVKDYVQL